MFIKQLPCFVLHLEMLFTMCEVTQSDIKVPSAKVICSNRLIDCLLKTSRDWYNLNRQEFQFRYIYHVFGLIKALWGGLGSSDIFGESAVERRELASEWLEDVTVDVPVDLIPSESSNDNATARHLLIRHRLIHAFLVAVKARKLNLAILLSNYLPDDMSIWLGADSDSSPEWTEWNDDFDEEVMQLYLLLMHADTKEQANLYKNLNWLGCLAFNMWYLTSPDLSLSHVVRNYSTAVEQGHAYYPYPLYQGTENVGVVCDLLYNLLMFYVDFTFPDQNIFDPASYGSDPSDYRLCFLMLQVFLSLGLEFQNQYLESRICMKTAAGLERKGEWHMAVFVLMFIKDTKLKKMEIFNVLLRNVRRHDFQITNEYKQKENKVVRDFRIPLSWIELAKCKQAYSKGDFVKVVELYIKNGWYREAYVIIMEHIFLKLISKGALRELYKLLKPLEEKGKQLERWSSHGKLVIEMEEFIMHVASVSDDVTQPGVINLVHISYTKLKNVMNRLMQWIELNDENYSKAAQKLAKMIFNPVCTFNEILEVFQQPPLSMLEDFVKYNNIDNEDGPSSLVCCLVADLAVERSFITLIPIQSDEAGQLEYVESTPDIDSLQLVADSSSENDDSTYLDAESSFQVTQSTQTSLLDSPPRQERQSQEPIRTTPRRPLQTRTRAPQMRTRATQTVERRRSHGNTEEMMKNLPSDLFSDSE